MQTSIYHNTADPINCQEVRSVLDNIEYAMAVLNNDKAQLAMRNDDLTRIIGFMAFALFVALAGIVWLVSPWAAACAWGVTALSLKHFARG